MPEPLEATLRRLKKERDEADRRYNDALTELDRALRPPSELPGPPPAYDEQQITPLNEAWNILPDRPAETGLRARLKSPIWRIVGPIFERQLTFNSRLIDHLNRNVAAHREAQLATDRLLTAMRDQLARDAELHSRLLYLLQQITPYVDTKDRDSAGGALVLNAALSALGDNIAKRWESMAAREHRFEARTAAIAAAHDDLRVASAAAQQAASAAKREVERIAAGSAAPPLSSTTAAPEASPREAFAGSLDAYKYVGFENQFRGSQDAIRSRLESYLPYFDGPSTGLGAGPSTGLGTGASTLLGTGQSHVLDVGCGRGEFLDLLAARGVTARGIDLNPEMVEVCRERGLDVTHTDAVSYLSSLDDGTLGGVFAAQVVEHLQPAYLLRFLELAFHKLAPGGALVLETLNPACWVAFFESYIRDITHVWPLHPETLKYLVVASGFPAASIEYRSPVPQQDRLQTIAAAEFPERDAGLVEAFNANVEKLNARIFTYLDYAIVATR
jgi:SAM-dependent methyltransferase